MAVHQPARPTNSQVPDPPSSSEDQLAKSRAWLCSTSVYSFTVKLDEKSRPLFRESSDSLAGLFSNINFKMITFEL